MNDIKRIETALITGTEKDAREALKALERIKNRLTAPTAGDQFREFPIGQEFTTQNPDTYVFVKTGETSAVRFGRHSHRTTYYPDVFAEGAFPSWDNASLRFKLIPVEEAEKS